MARLSRAESQASTRDQLVATAKQMFLRDGYSATSPEKVADAAGAHRRDPAVHPARGRPHVTAAYLLGAASR